MEERRKIRKVILISRKMKHYVYVLEGALPAVPPPHVAVKNVNIIPWHIVGQGPSLGMHGWKQGIEDTDFAPFAEERVNGVGPNESRAAGNKHSHLMGSSGC